MPWHRPPVSLACSLIALAGVWLLLPAPLPEILCVLSLVLLVLQGRSSLARASAPRATGEVLLGALGGLLLALAGGLAGYGGVHAPWPHEATSLFPGLSRSCALLSAACLLASAGWARLSRAWASSSLAPRWREPDSDSRWGPVVVLGLGLLWQVVVMLGYRGPLVQVDSWAQLATPRLFHLDPSAIPAHQPPLYTQLVVLTCSGEHYRRGLWSLIAIQHLLVVAMGLAVERVVRGATGRAWSAAVAGLLVACSGQLALYAQSIMSDVLAIALLVLSLVPLERSTRQASSHPRLLLGSGLLVGAALMTRQVMEAWWVVGAAYLLVVGPRPRPPSLAWFVGGALALPCCLVLHNYAFHARVCLTSATGRNLVYRAVEGMPDLTDPDAPPGDELEEARRRVWASPPREESWVGPYNKLRALGWSDARVDAFFQRIYFEQMRRHPWQFARVTLGLAAELALAREAGTDLVEFHNRITVEPGCPWPELAGTPAPPVWVSRLEAAEPTSRIPLLLLVVLAPLVSRHRARGLALLAAASIFYFLGVTAMVELALPRYRLPLVPFVAISVGLTLGALANRLEERRAGGAA